MDVRKFPVFISAALLLAWLLVGASGAFAAELAEEFSACRPLEPAAKRLECYDDAIDRHNEQKNPDPRATTSGGQTATETPSAEELFGKNADEVRRAVEQASGGEHLDQIEARVTELLSIAPGKVAISLDNGQLWRQTTTSSLRLSAGDVVTIRRASMGSYVLHKVGSARSMRVQRNN